MTRRLLAISLTALLSFSHGAAADTADDLLKLHQVRLAAQKTLGDFYMYNGMEGDQRYAQMIDASLREAEENLRQIGAMPGESSQALRSQLDQQWAGYESSLKNLVAQIKEQGFPDLQPIADLAARNQRLMELSDELYGRIQQESGTQVPPLTQQSREQSLLMQTISVDYASRSASVGGSFFGGPDEARPIDELVKEFAGRLDSMENAPQNTPQIQSNLENVSTKWRYIEKSLQNYNENSVPFLVNKYSDSIIEGLEAVAAQYAVAKL
ncbi:hypothetical protein [Zestomonas carbonaria]|uniref:Type IV pili methyl-accepting chemotaxis transducer N-term n=1 Tax=Zestomonas carbonaria TaxID=2762745 RepID=A0A7U7IBE7_9GAMM|nr:hypothetical protein [Pseudomonas carbonaria]CAD5108837.1 hypothetical protein PSEWESI4_03129 [Pseudomonas carbonaria]